jgi:SAM-dependent methyltransferase
MHPGHRRNRIDRFGRSISVDGDGGLADGSAAKAAIRQTTSQPQEKMRRHFSLIRALNSRQEPSPLERSGPISAPFNFNAAKVAAYSPEVTGRIILNSMRHRLGWRSFRGKRLLDFGCGVRFAQTIFNLEIPVARYFGIDVNDDAIRWLKDNLGDQRFSFAHIDMRNAMYNPNGRECSPDALSFLGQATFDAACMFSVITHQAPDDAVRIFAMLHPYAPRLYFTAFIDDDVADYAEKDPDKLRNMSTYSAAFLTHKLHEAGWTVRASYPPSQLQQTAFVCVRS